MVIFIIIKANGIKIPYSCFIVKTGFHYKLVKIPGCWAQEAGLRQASPWQGVCPSGVIKKWLVVYLYITYDKNALLIATVAIGIFLSMTSSDLSDYDSFIF